MEKGGGREEEESGRRRRNPSERHCEMLELRIGEEEELVLVGSNGLVEWPNGNGLGLRE
jgi:hypothetical protein